MKSIGHLRLEEIRLAPGQEWQEPAPVWRFVSVSAGAAYWLEALRPRALSEGELVILGPAAQGIFRASQINDVVLRGFTFAPSLFYGFFTMAERQFLDRTGSDATLSARFLPSTHPIAGKFAALATTSPATLSQRVALLGVAAGAIEEEMNLRQGPRSRGVSALHRFEQLIARLPDIEVVNHTPVQLASLCGCSARHFNRLFRSCFGISVRARQTQLRLIKARQLLSETEKKVLEIALDSGYRNLSLFNLLFKRQFGMTPSESRRRWKKDAGKLGMTLAVLAGLVSTPQGRPGFDLQFSDIQAGTVIETTSGCHASLFVFFPREAQASPESRNRFTRHDSPMENA